MKLFILPIILLLLTGCNSTNVNQSDNVVNTCCCGIEFSVYPTISMRVGLFNTIVDFKK